MLTNNYENPHRRNEYNAVKNSVAPCISFYQVGLFETVYAYIFHMVNSVTRHFYSAAFARNYFTAGCFNIQAVENKCQEIVCD